MTTTTTTDVLSLGYLAQLAGSETTDQIAQTLRDLLIERDLLVWKSDKNGGTLTCTDNEWEQAMIAVLSR